MADVPDFRSLIQIVEEVRSALTVVYHRTKTHQNIETIRHEGFRAGRGATYGVGIYATYDIESQLREEMEGRYGPFIIKSAVRLHDFLICDYNVAEKVYGDRHTIVDQIAARGFKVQDGGEEIVQSISNQLRHLTITSSLANNLRQYVSGMRGLVYTGETDGRCIVAYDETTITPMAWAETDLKDSFAFADQLEWHSIIDRKLANPVARLVAQHPEQIGRIPNPPLAAQCVIARTRPDLLSKIHNLSGEALLHVPTEYAGKKGLELVVPFVSRFTTSELRQRAVERFPGLIAYLPNVRQNELRAAIRDNPYLAANLPIKFEAAIAYAVSIEPDVLMRLKPEMLTPRVIDAVSIKSLMRVYRRPVRAARPLKDIKPEIVQQFFDSYIEVQAPLGWILRSAIDENKFGDAIKEAARRWAAMVFRAFERLVEENPRAYFQAPAMPEIARYCGKEGQLLAIRRKQLGERYHRANEFLRYHVKGTQDYPDASRLLGAIIGQFAFDENSVQMNHYGLSWR